MIVGLMSTYREGRLAQGALRTLLPACDVVGILDAPIEGSHGEGEPSQFGSQPPNVYRMTGHGMHVYRNDAAKRNALLGFAMRQRREKKEPVWCVWLDGDELLMWGEWLPDWIARADEETGVGGFPVRIVELDGSVAYSHNRVFRGDRVRKFLVGASQVELHTGMVVALPNTPICGAGGIPVHPDGGAQAVATPEAQAVWLARCRPPVAGEPHVLHRSVIRSKHRGIERQHEAESRAFDDMVR